MYLVVANSICEACYLDVEFNLGGESAFQIRILEPFGTLDGKYFFQNQYLID